MMVHIVTDKDATIEGRNLRPHYTDSRFYSGQEHTVFLAQGYTLTKSRNPTVKGANYDYSDRLWQWDYKKAEAARARAIEIVPDTYSARFYETFLRLYYGNEAIELVHIVTGVNVSNGYDYQVYGYITPPADSALAQPEADA